jgi:hypothetical protein
MRYSYLILALATLMQASAAPSGDIICPGPPAVLRALQPDTCAGKACTTLFGCCTCYVCNEGVSAFTSVHDAQQWLTGALAGLYTVNLSSGKEIDGVKFCSFYVMEDGGLYLLHSWNVVEIYQWLNARARLIAVLSIHPMKSNRRNI